MSLSKLTKYWACHEKWISWLILVTHETLFTMRGVTTVIVQTHQILRLPRKMNLMIDPCHTWNAIYNARSNKCHCPNSPNTAPATQSNTHHWSLSHMKRYLQCAEQQVSLSKLTKYCACHAKWLSWYCHDWSSSHMKRYLQCAEQQVASSNITKYCACHAKWLSNISKKFLENSWNVISNAGPIRAGSDHDPRMKPSSATRLATEVTFQDHHEHFVLKNTTFRAPAIIPNFTEYCACHEKWHFNFTEYCACHAKWLSWYCHDWSSSHMKRYLQCAEQPVASSNITKYCACHAKWLSNISKKFLENSWNVISNAGPIREWSDPRMIRATSEQHPSRKPSAATRLATEVTFQDHHEHFVLKNTTFRAPAIIPNFTEYCACHEKWHFNFTKYCACHEKWISWLILVTHETLFTMRGATSVIVQTHQILRLPRKMKLMIDQHDIWNAIYNARNNRWHPPTSPNTAPATQNDCHDWSSSHMKRYLQCAEQQVASSNITKYCACHAKWLSKISKKFLENRWNVNSNARPIRDRSENDPTMIREWNRHPQPASQPRLLFRTTTSILYWKI